MTHDDDEQYERLSEQWQCSITHYKATFGCYFKRGYWMIRQFHTGFIQADRQRNPFRLHERLRPGKATRFPSETICGF